MSKEINPFSNPPQQYLYIFIVSNQGRNNTAKIKAADYNSAVDEIERKYPDFDTIKIIGKPMKV